MCDVDVKENKLFSDEGKLHPVKKIQRVEKKVEVSKQMHDVSEWRFNRMKFFFFRKLHPVKEIQRVEKTVEVSKQILKCIGKTDAKKKFFHNFFKKKLLK